MGSRGLDAEPAKKGGEFRHGVHGTRIASRRAGVTAPPRGDAGRGRFWLRSPADDDIAPPSAEPSDAGVAQGGTTLRLGRGSNPSPANFLMTGAGGASDPMFPPVSVAFPLWRLPGRRRLRPLTVCARRRRRPRPGGTFLPILWAFSAARWPRAGRLPQNAAEAAPAAALACNLIGPFQFAPARLFPSMDATPPATIGPSTSISRSSRADQPEPLGDRHLPPSSPRSTRKPSARRQTVDGKSFDRRRSARLHHPVDLEGLRLRPCAPGIRPRGSPEACRGRADWRGLQLDVSTR